MAVKKRTGMVVKVKSKEKDDALETREGFRINWDWLLRHCHVIFVILVMTGFLIALYWVLH